MRLIIDTDTAGDDCFSLLLAMSEPKARLEAVTICNGNVDFDHQVENALYTIQIAGMSGRVPVYRGCRKPLLRDPVDAAYVFGKDGMSDAGYPRARQRPEAGHAVDAIIDLVMSNPGEITMIAQAPLTNVALAVSREPRIAKALKHLWVMGGADNGMGNVTPAAEFNFYVDPEAAAIVFKAGFDITLVTWTLCLSAGLGEAELKAIEDLGTPRARFFTQVNSAAVAFSRDRYGHGDTLHPDGLTAALCLDESLILEAEPCRVEIETASALTRAYSSVSSARLPPPEEADPALKGGAPNARVIKRVDREGFRDRMIRALSLAS